ncbi:MAG TPA: ATP-dependent DNA helicase RecG [Alphaproteobacteria bacterium]|nr:ATP-dependent DNA helicase RecG [Alphaproteobacteria bacterium]
MRPSVLFPLFASVTSLPGVGPRLATLFDRAVGADTEAGAKAKVADLLWHLPTGLIDRRFAPKVAEAPAGVIATLTVQIDRHMPPHNPRMPYRVRCHDETGTLFLVFFHARGDYLSKLLPVGDTRVVSGRIERFRDEAQMTHPDHVGTPDEFASLAAIEPVYRLTTGLTPKVMAKAVRGALDKAPELPEWLDEALRVRQGWTSWRAALAAAHAPQEPEDLLPTTAARRRLAYDELLANQLALALVRMNQRRLPGRRIKGDGHLRAKALAALPFDLTRSQKTALSEIDADMAADGRMLRLLQGDVGSGKTVVALMAMLNAIEAGMQAALMAPTEILARQHYQTIAPLAERAGVAAALLTGREKGHTRDGILAGLADGSTPLVVGTHALFQDDVEFKNLGFAVIDEQHRFGVHQRLGLAAKGADGKIGIDVLVMTATPIPRTLMLCAYGDMEQSRLTEKPPGRQPIDTRVAPLSRLDEVAAGIGRQIERGARAYWVCPLVEESEATDLAAATDRHADLVRRFGADQVGLVHGRMKGTEKDAVMARFQSGMIRALVATTVIEVGVDVPEATIMVIEHAERFGLAQLHQLRGRIGRGSGASTCLLLYAEPLGETAKARLTIMRETEDGFRIAEEDLRLRGAGELLGTRQSGLPEFKLADLAAHEDLLSVARDDARLVLERDPTLASERGERLRMLLYLFERDAAVRLVRSG